MSAEIVKLATSRREERPRPPVSEILVMAIRELRPDLTDVDHAIAAGDSANDAIRRGDKHTRPCC
jgi:hypothetical protein